MRKTLLSFIILLYQTSAVAGSTPYYPKLKLIEKDKLVDINQTSQQLKAIGKYRSKFSPEELELYKLLLGHSKVMSGEYAEGQEILEKLSRRATISDYKARAYSFLANLYQMNNENVKAFISVDQAKSLLSKVEDKEYRFGIIANTVSVYKNSDLLEFALEDARKLVREATKVKTNRALCASQFELADIEYLAGKLDLAKQRLFIAKEYCKKAKEKIAIVMINNTLSAIMLGKGDFQETVEHLDKAFPLAAEYGWDILITYYYVRFGEAYLGLDKPEEAWEYAKKALELSEKIPDGRADELVVSLLARVNSKLGNKEKALEYYKKYMEINMENEAKIRQRKLAFDIARRGKL